MERWRLAGKLFQQFIASSFVLIAGLASILKPTSGERPKQTPGRWRPFAVPVFKWVLIPTRGMEATKREALFKDYRHQ
jgi:uncharacterized membrane protein